MHNGNSPRFADFLSSRRTPREEFLFRNILFEAQPTSPARPELEGANELSVVMDHHVAIVQVGDRSRRRFLTAIGFGWEPTRWR